MNLPLPNTPDDDRRLTTKEAAAYLRVSPSTLERYRLHGTPRLRYVKFGGLRGRVFYRKSDLDAFLAASVYESTSEYGRTGGNGSGNGEAA